MTVSLSQQHLPGLLSLPPKPFLLLFVKGILAESEYTVKADEDDDETLVKKTLALGLFKEN